MQTITLAYIKSRPVYGNHASDYPTFNLIESFIRQQCASAEDKCEALRYQCEVLMGCPFSDSDNLLAKQQPQAFVDEYIANC